VNAAKIEMKIAGIFVKFTGNGTIEWRMKTGVNIRKEGVVMKMAIKKVCSRCKNLFDKLVHGYCEDCYLVIIKEREIHRLIKQNRLGRRK
jgi:hypothetical protein